MIELSNHTLYVLLGTIVWIFYCAYRRSGAIGVSVASKRKLQNGPSSTKTTTTTTTCQWPPTPEERHWLWKHAKALRNAKGDASSHDILFLRWMQRLRSKVIMFEVPVLGKLIVIGDASFAKHVLQTKVRDPENGGKQRCAFPKSPTYRKNTPLLGKKSIVTMEGAEWAQHRRIFNPGFSPEYLRGVVGTITKKCNRLLEACEQDDIANQRPTNLLTRAIDLTSDVIAQVAFGEDWGRHSQNQHGGVQTLEDFRELIDLIGALKNPIQRLNLKNKWRMSELEESLDNDMKRLVERRVASIQTHRQQRPDNKEGEEHKKSPPKDILSLALSGILHENQLRDETTLPPLGTEFSETEMESLTSQLKTFYFAGHDTTATTIAWAFWSLLQNPEALQKARDEVRDHLGEDWVAAVERATICKDSQTTTDDILPEESITYEKLQCCQYLDAISRETLRLYPPAQTARHSYDNPDATFGNYKIGGSVLVLNFYAIQRDPDLWGSDANQFRPERFMGAEGRSKLNSFGFLPFSGGSRDCIGKYFALLEIKIALAALVTRYNGTAVDANQEVLTARLTSIPKNGCLVQLERVQNPSPQQKEELAS